VVERLGLSAWDWLFLASGFAFVALGIALVRGPRRTAVARIRPMGRSENLKSPPG
jgi:hypothetical protein